MQTQEYRLTINDEETYNKIYEEYSEHLRQAKIMISDYFDSELLTLLKDKVFIRLRVEDGRTVVQTKKQLQLSTDKLFVSESKEELEANIKDSKMYKYLLKQYNLNSLHKVLTLRTMRQMYFCENFDFILDKTEYFNHLNNEKGVLFELQMDIFSLSKGDENFLKELQDKYHLEKSTCTKMERILAAC